MAIAITVTAELKSLNDGKNPNTNNLFSSYLVGDIRLFQQYPTIFYSPTYNNGRLTGGYNKLSDVSIYENDGFYSVENPVYDTETQYLGSLFFDVDIFKYNILDYTPEQLEQRENEKKNNEISDFINQLINDGLSYFSYIREKIIKSYLLSEFSPAEPVNLNVLSDIMGAYEDNASEITRGSWLNAKEKLNTVIFVNAKAQELNNEFKLYISDYVDNNYTTINI